jgi:effector-binding domain-containing protein
MTTAGNIMPKRAKTKNNFSALDFFCITSISSPPISNCNYKDSFPVSIKAQKNQPKTVWSLPKNLLTKTSYPGKITTSAFLFLLLI